MRADSGWHELLCCPACQGALGLAPGERAPDGHILTGTLACETCAAAYPITRGVPRLAPGVLAGHVARTVEAFGYQWNRANEQLRDPRFSAPEVLLDFVQPVSPAWFQGKTVLDAGCGFGRFSLAAAAFGAATVVGFDLSTAVDAAFDNTRHLPGVLIIQADISAPPLRRAFDYAFSVGVLHHTADPEQSFLRLAATVKPGGSLSAWVYAREGNGWIIYGLNPVRRITSHIPRPLLLAASYAAAVPLWLLTQTMYRRGAHPASWRRRLFYFEYLAFLSQFDLRAHAFVIFDHAVPAIAEYINREAFQHWFETAGLQDVAITMRHGSGWRGFGRLP